MLGKLHAAAGFFFFLLQAQAQYLRPCRNGELYGYCDSSGNVKIPQVYSRALPFRDRLAPVIAADGFWWFIDRRGIPMFNTRKWADQDPPQMARGLLLVEYHDAREGKIREYYNRSGLPVKVPELLPEGEDSIPYTLFSAEKALENFRLKAGNSEKADCLGFIRSGFRPYGIYLPFMPADLSVKGREIPASEIQPGDLVFFGGENKGFEKTVRLIGVVSAIHKDDFEFIHACRTGSAEISRGSDPLYRKRFLFARRVFN